MVNLLGNITIRMVRITRAADAVEMMIEAERQTEEMWKSCPRRGLCRGAADNS